MLLNALWKIVFLYWMLKKIFKEYLNEAYSRISFHKTFLIRPLIRPLLSFESALPGEVLRQCSNNLIGTAFYAPLCTLFRSLILWCFRAILSCLHCISWKRHNRCIYSIKMKFLYSLCTSLLTYYSYMA